MSNRFVKLAFVAAALAAATPAVAGISGSDPFEAYSAVLGAGQNAVAVRHLRNVPSVGVVHVDNGAVSPTSKYGEIANDILITADKKASGIGALRNALSANPVTRHALAAHGVDIGRVIGVQIGSSGSLRVFTE